MAGTNDLGHPPSVIRLVSAVHRFKVPQIVQDTKICFVDSFKTTGSNERTKIVLENADDARLGLGEALKANNISYERVVSNSKCYIPLINQILLSCKVQPEVARLDERLIFEWLSGIEREPTIFKSEALMFDFVMAIACEGFARAGMAVENSASRDFATSTRDYAAAAGIFDFLANHQLPKWMAKGANVEESNFPIECSVGVAGAINKLFIVYGQQMAIATILSKSGIPNFSLVAKLCLGVHEQLDGFIITMQREASSSLSKMDEDFIMLTNFQIAFYKAISLYFQARSLWNQGDYGVAIALLRDGLQLISTDYSKPVGSVSFRLPDISKSSTFLPLHKDLLDLKQHMMTLSTAWESDNSHIFYETVPRNVAPEKYIQGGFIMDKQETYILEEVEPFLLFLPEDFYYYNSTSLVSPMHRSDRNPAGEFQRHRNQEDSENSPLRPCSNTMEHLPTKSMLQWVIDYFTQKE